MQTEHYYIYLYGSLKHKNVDLDTIMTYLRANPDEHIFFLRHADQVDEMGGLGLMYGVQVHAMTWKDWLTLVQLYRIQNPFNSGSVHRKRLPHLIVSNYVLPNLMGM